MVDDSSWVFQLLQPYWELMTHNRCQIETARHNTEIRHLDVRGDYQNKLRNNLDNSYLIILNHNHLQRKI